MQDIAALIQKALSGFSKEKKPDKVADCIAGYIKAYDAAAATETRFKTAKRRKEEAKAELINYMTGLGTTQLSRDGRTIVYSLRSYGKVVDYDTFIDWVENYSDEPRSQFLQEVIIKGSNKDPRGLHALVQDAQERSIKTGVPINKCFPPGIHYSVVDVITLRKSRKATQPTIAETAIERLEGLQQGEDAL